MRLNDRLPWPAETETICFIYDGGVEVDWLTAFSSNLTGTFNLSSALEGHMMHALCVQGQSKLDIFLDRQPTVFVLCVKHLAQICWCWGCCILFKCRYPPLCKPIRPQYGIFILNCSFIQHYDHGTFKSPSHCKQMTDSGNLQR